jgi:hypothetical protein
MSASADAPACAVRPVWPATWIELRSRRSVRVVALYEDWRAAEAKHPGTEEKA